MELTRDEVALALNVSLPGLSWRRRNDPDLPKPVRKQGNSLLWDKVEIDAYLDARKNNKNTPKKGRKLAALKTTSTRKRSSPKKRTRAAKPATLKTRANYETQCVDIVERIAKKSLEGVWGNEPSRQVGDIQEDIQQLIIEAVYLTKLKKNTKF